MKTTSLCFSVAASLHTTVAHNSRRCSHKNSCTSRRGMIRCIKILCALQAVRRCQFSNDTSLLRHPRWRLCPVDLCSYWRQSGRRRSSSAFFVTQKKDTGAQDNCGAALSPHTHANDENFSRLHRPRGAELPPTFACKLAHFLCVVARDRTLKRCFVNAWAQAEKVSCHCPHSNSRATISCVEHVPKKKNW